MNTARARRFLDTQGIVYDIDDVAAGTHTSGQTSKFWPYRLAVALVYGEIAGIKKLPGRLVLAPMPVLGKICPVRREIVRGYIEEGVNIGIFEDVEFYSNHAIITVAKNPWESGMLDYDCGHTNVVVAAAERSSEASNTIPPTHP